MRSRSGLSPNLTHILKICYTNNTKYSEINTGNEIVIEIVWQLKHNRLQIFAIEK